MVDKINETDGIDYTQSLQDYAKQIVQNERESAQVFESMRNQNNAILPFQKYGNVQSFLSSQAREFGSVFTGGILPLINDRFKSAEQKRQQKEESEYWEGYNWIGATAAYLSPLAKIPALGAFGEAISTFAVVPKLGATVATKIAPNVGRAGQLAAMGATDMATYEFSKQLNQNSLTDFENANLTNIIAAPILAAPGGAITGVFLGKLFGELNPLTESAEQVLTRSEVSKLNTMPKSSLGDLSQAYERIDAQAKGEVQTAAEAQLNPKLFAWGESNVTAQAVQNAYHFEAIVQDADALLTKFETMPESMTEKDLHDVRFYRGFLSSLAYNKGVRDELITYGTTDLQNFFNQAKLASDANFKFRNPKTGELATNPKIPLLLEIKNNTNSVYETIRDYRNAAKDLEKGIPLEPVNEQFTPPEQFNLVNDIIEAPTSFLKSSIKRIKRLINPKDGLQDALVEYRFKNPGQPVDEGIILSTLEGERAGITNDYLKHMDGALSKAATEYGFASKADEAAFNTELKALNAKTDVDYEVFLKENNIGKGVGITSESKNRLRQLYEEIHLQPEIERLKLKYGRVEGLPKAGVPKPSQILSMLMRARKLIGDVRFQLIGKFAPKEKANWIQNRTAIQREIDKFGPTAVVFSENTAALDSIDKALRGITRLFRTEGKPLTQEGDKILGLKGSEIKKLGPSSESAGNLDLTEFLPKLNDLYEILQESSATLEANLGLEAAPYLANVKVAMDNVKRNMDTLYAMNNRNVKRWYSWQTNLNKAASGEAAPEGMFKEDWRLIKMALDFMLPGEQRFGAIQAVRFVAANFKSWFRSNAYKEPFEKQLEKQIQLIRATNKQTDALKKEIKTTLESFLGPAKGAAFTGARTIINFIHLQNTDDGKKKIEHDFQKTVSYLHDFQQNPQRILKFIQQTKAMDTLAPEGSRKMTDRVFGILQFLNSQVPKGPGIMEGGGLPAIAQQARFNDQYLAATSPMITLEMIKQGAPSPEHKQVSKMFWPEFWTEMENQADAIIIENPKLNMIEKSKLKGLLSIPTLASIPSMPTQQPSNKAPMPEQTQQPKKNISSATVSAINKWQPQRQYGGFTQYGKPS